MAQATVGEVILKDVWLSFPALFQPGKPMKNDDGEEVSKYKSNFLIKKSDNDPRPQDTANEAKIRTAMREVIAAKWPGKKLSWKADRLCFRDGNSENWDGYEGMMYLSANNLEQPALVDKVKDEKGKLVVLTKANGGPKKLYAGARVNAIVRIWAQDSEKYGKRINCSVESVQFYKHDTPFSGHTAVDPNEKFDDIPDDEDDDIGGSGVEDDDDDLI